LREGGWLYVFNTPFRAFLSTSSSSTNPFCLLVGYRHLILRVEFAKRTT
jgi:hypothetical protein